MAEIRNLTRNGETFYPLTHEKAVIGMEDFKDTITEQIDNYRPIEITGDVVNAPDEEDITSDANNLLKFKNRNNLYGLGKVILRRGSSFVSQVTQANTIYVIQYNFDLEGTRVNIPNGSILMFEGGTLSNGTLVCADLYDVRLVYYQDISVILNSVTLEGNFIYKACDKDTIGGISVDNSSIEENELGQLTVKAEGIQNTHLNSSIVDQVSLVLDSNNKISLKDGGVTGNKLNSGIVNTDDLSIVNSKIQLANRSTSNGMGKIILRKDQSFASQLTQQNTIYVIRYDFTLTSDITIPANCILEFDGGSIDGSENNYKLTGTNTKIVYNSSVFDNIVIDGNWLVQDIYSWIFKDIAEEDKLRQLFNLCSEDIENNVYISKLTNPYVIVPKNNEYYTSTGISLKSNTNIYNNGIIKIKPNSDYQYCIFAIYDYVHDIVIDGGEYIGDNYEGEHDFTQAPEGKESEEWGYCFWSHRTSEFITIKNIYAHHFIGDFMELNSKNVVIDNIVIHNNRRQGISICDCSNVIISNFEIYNIGINLGTIQGTDPRSAIDIEPNFWDAHNITIENGYIHDCYRGLVCSNSSYLIYNNTYKNIIIENISGYAIRHFTATDCVYDNIQIKNISGEQPSAVKSLCVFGQCDNISFINSSIIENSETFDSYAIQEVEGNNLIFDNLYINVRNGIAISSNNILRNSILKVATANGNFDKCTITILPSSASTLSVVGIFKDCKLFIKNTIGWYISQATNCDFYVNDVLNSAVFTIMPNVNTKVVGCTFNVSANNTLFYNPYITSKGALIDCVYNFTADNVNIGSNIERLFIGSGSTSALNQIDSNIINKGKQAFNTSVARPVFWNGAWKDANGFDPAKTVGNTSERPDISAANEGFCYFDKTLNKPIWASKVAGDTVVSEIATANTTTYMSTTSMEEGKEYKVTKGSIGSIGIYFVNEDESKSITIIDSAGQTESFIICPNTSVYTKIRCDNRGNAMTVSVIKMIVEWVDATGISV